MQTKLSSDGGIGDNTPLFTAREKPKWSVRLTEYGFKIG
jgi:hypothetical protein